MHEREKMQARFFLKTTTLGELSVLKETHLR